MTVLRPVIIGVVMAYVINLLMRPMETKWLAGLWRRCPRLARGKRGLCIVPPAPERDLSAGGGPGASAADQGGREQ